MFVFPQGFLIFVFRCLCNPEAKLGWLQLFTTGTLKRRRGPIKSQYTDTSSRGSESHARNSTGFLVSGSTKTSLTGLRGGKHGNDYHPYSLHTTSSWHPSLNAGNNVRNESDFAPGYGTLERRASNLSGKDSLSDSRGSGQFTALERRDSGAFVEDHESGNSGSSSGVNGNTHKSQDDHGDNVHSEVTRF